MVHWNDCFSRAARARRIPLHILLCLLFCLQLPLRAGIINFDSLSDLDIVTTHFPGLTFSNTLVLASGAVGGSLNEFEFPPRSLYNVASDNGGPITINFVHPVLSFGVYATYLAQLTLTGFSGPNQVAQTASLFNSNLALSGEVGSLPNELLYITFSGGITGVTIAGDPLGGSFTVDDVTYVSGVPEPASIVLLLVPVALSWLLNQRRQNKLTKKHR